MTFVVRYKLSRAKAWGIFFLAQNKFRILISLFGVLVLTKFFVDPDLGWNLVMGREFFRFGEIGGPDHFSWTMPGYSWPNTYLGYQIIFSFLFDNFGFLATAIFFGMVGSAAILILIPKRIPGIAILVLPVVFGLAASILGLRPHNLDFLFFAIVVKLMVSRRFEYRFWPLWFVIFCFWANVHAGYFVGFGIFATYLLLTTIAKQRYLRPGIFLKPLGLITLCYLATLITPFGFYTFGNLVTNYAGFDGFWNIAENQPTILFFPQSILFTLSGVLLVWALKKTKGDKWPLILVSIAAFMLAFVSFLFLVYWTILFAVLMFEVFEGYKLPKFILVAGKSFVVRFSILVAVLAIALNFVANLLTGYDLRERLFWDNYPVNALRFMQSHGYTNNVFNKYDWGGFVIWQAPQMKVFIDGRMTGWRYPDGRGILGDYLKIRNGDCDPLAKYDVRVVLLGAKDSLKCFDNYKIIYRDNTAKVLVRH